MSQTNLIVGCSVLLMAASAFAQEQDDAIYTTSFEGFPVGMLGEHEHEGLTWKGDGRSEVTSDYHNTGSKALHLFGGTDTTLELSLVGDLQECRGLRFEAERWTAKSPFQFRIHAETDGVWQEISNLDQLVVTGRGFLSHVVLATPQGARITGLRLICTAPANAGVLIDDFALLRETPRNVTRAPAVATEPIARLLEDQALFVSGTEDTHTFRIPALITAANGDLIAACDARRSSRADLIHVRDIDIVVKRSSDNGATWSDMELVCDFGDGRPASDPSLILDRTTGEIFCFYNYMDQDKAPGEFRLYVQRSRDDGRTWGRPRDITQQIAKPEWKKDFKFITSGRGIQTRSGELLHTMVNLESGLHLFGSKDHGKTWHMIDVPVIPGNESKVIELADGRLMINSRARGKGCRWVHRSEDGGRTWVSGAERGLVDPSCNGSIIRYTSREDGYEKNRLLFCNANSFQGRKNLAVRISYDEGDSWSDGKVIDPGPSAYSSLTICEDGSIAVLYEPGYEEVRFARFTLEDLTDGEDELSKPYGMNR